MTAKVSLAALAVSLLAAATASLLATGCGEAAEEDGDTNLGVPRFGDMTTGGGGVNGAVNPPAALCVAGAARCGGASTVERCNAAGTAFETSQCGAGSVCTNGTCIQFTCTAGDRFCFGPELHTCNADERSTTLNMTCGAGEACRQSTLACAPVVCEPLEPTCSGNVATRCDNSGFGYDFLSASLDCGAQGCNAGACRVPEGMNPLNPIDMTMNPLTPVSQACTPNQVSCTGNTLTRCNPAGNQVTQQDCSAGGGSCGMGSAGLACLTAPRCTPGQVTCDGANTIGTCNAAGNDFAITRCPEGTNCTGAGTCTPVRCNQAAMRTSNGTGATVTVYWFAQKPTEEVNCSFGAQRNNDTGANDRVPAIQDPGLFGAMNLAVYDGAAACGACVALTPINGGQPVTITVADSCNPGIDNNTPCRNNTHIDLSRNAFGTLTNANTGNLGGVSWRYVPCEGVDNVQFVLKEPTNAYWNEFLVTNHKYPIKKAEVLMEGNRWVEAQRTEYNYWHPAEGANGEGGDMGTYRVRVTDINDGIIEEQLELRAGPQGGSGQFGCQ